MWESTSHLQPECKRRDKRLQGEFSFQFRDYCRPPSLPEASPAIHTQQSHLPVFTVTYSLPRLGEGHSDILVVQSGMTTLCWGRLLRHKEQMCVSLLQTHNGSKHAIKISSSDLSNSPISCSVKPQEVETRDGISISTIHYYLSLLQNDCMTDFK
ncbi:uncharacterized protein LOC125626378 isoform X1 [Caretta caretta]|uniref:uncharacterized protein LOC125626378 isoform X1 n=1 Tax=Caretta caretta TaxID=8467 RepID=UPI002094E4BE|nr:uncharacterized protein LOC125626378 isoform X2 [Caretta caretta]